MDESCASSQCKLLGLEPGSLGLSRARRGGAGLLLRKARCACARVSCTCGANQVGAGIGGGLPNHGVFSASQSPASSPNRSISGSNTGYPYMQAEIAEGLAILRGIKRSMQARQMWVEAEEHQNQCSQQ